MRSRSARWRRLFFGKKYLFWKLLLVIAIMATPAAWFYGVTALSFISAAIGLMALQLALWWRLYLKDLPIKEDHADKQLCLDCLAEPELLARLKPNQSPRQLWQALENSWQLNFIANRLQISSSFFEQSLSDRFEDSKAVWNMANQIGQSMPGEGIKTGALVAALMLSAEDGEAYLQQNKLSPEDVEAVALWQARTAILMKKLQQKRSFGGIARDWAAGYTPLLNRFAQDLSADVVHGAYQHLYLQTHSQALEQALQHLSGSKGAAVALVGGTGSGKTSLAYALTERLLDPDNKTLRYHKVFALNASLVISEAKRIGNLESLLLSIVAEARRARNVILFFDDAHSFFAEESGASDMSNVLLQLIRSGSIRMLFAFRPEDWQYLTSKAGDITARLHQIKLQDPDKESTVKVLEDQALGVEAETKTSISYAAIKEAYELADRYMPDQSFPGKAISLLESSAQNTQGGWVLPVTVQQTIEASLGVKVGSAAPEESDALLNLEDSLHQYMINQDFAVSAVSNALRRARAGVGSQQRPVGSFLFLGPTGVGKTELCKALARVYYQGEDSIIRVDMSEYSQADSSQRLLASSAVAGSFLASVRSAPFNVVLLDEVEKSSDEVMNLLLQMLDEGQLTDVDGKEVSFRDAIIIATSNAGADIIRNKIEAGHDLSDFSSSFMDQLIDSRQFKPELINRFDEAVLFRPLDKQELRQVAQLLLDEINQNMAKQKIKVGLTEAAVDKIVEEGYDPRLGARPMRRMMQRTVENVVAKKVLSKELQPGMETVLDVGDLSSNGS